MSQPPSSNSQEKSASDNPFYLPHYYSHGDYYSEISDNEIKEEDKKPENDSSDWDSFGDLILFI